MIYTRLIRPLLFRLDPEWIHKAVSFSLRTLFSMPLIPSLVRSYCRVRHPRLRRELFGMSFESPVGIAAGFDKHIRLYNDMAVLGFSHIEIGTVTPKGQPGNPKPRLFRLPADKALVNRMGFNNEGAASARERLRARKPRLIVGGNIGKNTLTPNDQAVDDYLEVFRTLFEVVDYFVVNVSCPNITDLAELQDRDKLQAILRALMDDNRGRQAQKPVLLKVSPDLNEEQLDDVIALVKEEGLAGVVATNTTITRDGLGTGPEQVAAIGKGGLSGLPLRERSTQVIRYLAEKSGKAFPIIGVGGIMTPEDALEKLDAGADLVQVYTGFIYQGPLLARRINKAILARRT